MAIIGLESIRIFAYHGLYPEEQESGNHFRVDLHIDTGNRPISESDKIEDTIDYSLLFKVVEEVMSVRQDLLETLVSKIGRRIIDELDDFDAVTVRVTKESPPLKAEVASSFVQATFHKS